MISIVSYRPLAVNYEVLPPFANTKSLSFDGVDDYVSTGLNLGYTNYPNISLSCWVKMDNALLTNYAVYNPMGVHVAAFGNSSPISLYRGSVVQGTKVYIQGAASSYGTTNISDGAWHHIVQTCQYDAAGTICNIYVDGNPTPEIANALLRSYAPLTGDLIIGAATSTFRRFIGNVDEVSVFDSILSTSDIADIYNLGTPTDLTSLNPIAWYRNGDNGAWKSPQWLIPSNENKDNISNYSMHFDGLRRMPVGSITLGTDNIVSLWLKRDVTNTQETLLGEISNTSNYFMVITTTNKLYLRFGATAYVGYTSASVISVLNDTTNWINIIVVRGGNSVELFLNGLSMGTGDDINGVPGVIETRFDEVAGANGSFRTTGAFNNVAAWNVNTVLPSEIFNGGTPPDLLTLSTVPVNWWKMSDNSTWTQTTWNVPDEIGTNDGTIDFLDIFGRIGEAPNSTSNAVSLNMDEVDRTTDVPT